MATIRAHLALPNIFLIHLLLRRKRQQISLVLVEETDAVTWLSQQRGRMQRARVPRKAVVPAVTKCATADTSLVSSQTGAFVASQTLAVEIDAAAVGANITV